MIRLRKKIISTAFAVAGLTFWGGYAQASDYDNPTGIMQTINSATKHKSGVKYVKVAPKRLYINKNAQKQYSSGSVITGFAVSLTPTLTEIKTYLNSTHHYEISTSQGDHTHSFKIGNTTYYYTPNENDTNIIKVANTGNFVAGTSDDYLFTDGVNYWKYDLKNTGSLAWTKIVKNDSSFGGDTTTFPKVGTINYSDDGAGTLSKAEGVVRLKLPVVGDNTEQYYNFEFTPIGTKQEQITNLEDNVDGGYFYGLANDNGGGIHNSSDSNYSIVADFIKKRTCSSADSFAEINKESEKVQELYDKYNNVMFGNQGEK